MSSAEARGWGPGWPHSASGDKLVTLSFANGLRLPVRREAATLIGWAVNETNRRGYECRNGWCWGFGCRAIRGSTSPSNSHSWGLAVDINAPKNPMLNGTPGWAALHANGRTDMPAWVPQLWKSLGFGWGGDYPRRQDAMHFEWLGTPGDMARVTAGLAGSGPVAPHVAVTAPAGVPPMRLDDEGPRVAALQVALNAGTGARLNADGRFGPLTVKAVTNLQARFELTVDGVYGPASQWVLQVACNGVASR